MSETSDAHERTKRWVQGAVIGLNFCPFAQAPWQQGRVHIAVESTQDFDACVRSILAQIQRLVEAPEEELSSILVVFESALGELDDFLDAMEVVVALADESGVAEWIQIAHFHPDYRFEGVAADDLGNYTNRAPLPTCHLLRIDEVERAIQAHPDSLQIPADNVARLRTLGPQAVAELWKNWR